MLVGRLWVWLLWGSTAWAWDLLRKGLSWEAQHSRGLTWTAQIQTAALSPADWDPHQQRKCIMGLLAHQPSLCIRGLEASWDTGLAVLKAGEAWADPEGWSPEGAAGPFEAVHTSPRASV